MNLSRFQIRFASAVTAVAMLVMVGMPAGAAITIDSRYSRVQALNLHPDPAEAAARYHETTNETAPFDESVTTGSRPQSSGLTTFTSDAYGQASQMSEIVLGADSLHVSADFAVDAEAAGDEADYIGIAASSLNLIFVIENDATFTFTGSFSNTFFANAESVTFDGVASLTNLDSSDVVFEIEPAVTNISEDPAVDESGTLAAGMYELVISLHAEAHDVDNSSPSRVTGLADSMNFQVAETAMIPEPGMAGLALAGGLLTVVRRRR